MKVIFIIGMHRCGTSLLTSYIEKLGFEIGKSKNKDKDWQNPKGYFENDNFTEFHDNLLEYNGYGWDNVKEINLKYTKEHVDNYCKLIKEEFTIEKIVIKDPRLSFFTNFLNEVIKKLNIEAKFLFATRKKEECVISLMKAQKRDRELCENIYDITHKTFNNNMLKVNYNNFLKNNKEEFKKICNFINEEYKEINNIDNSLYRNKFIPLEKFPYRSPLDLVFSLKKFTLNKSVCDLGCSFGDLIFFLKYNNFCKSIIGLEIDEKKITNERKKYILNRDLFKDEIPEADIYLYWIGDHNYENVISKIKKNSLVIFLDGIEETHQKFSKIKGIELVEKIEYQYDETQYYDDILKYEEELKSLQKINPNWKIKGKRFYKVYKYT